MCSQYFNIEMLRSCFNLCSLVCILYLQHVSICTCHFQVFSRHVCLTILFLSFVPSSFRFFYTLNVGVLATYVQVVSFKNICWELHDHVYLKPGKSPFHSLSVLLPPFVCFSPSGIPVTDTLFLLSRVTSVSSKFHIFFPLSLCFEIFFPLGFSGHCAFSLLLTL